MAIARSDQSLIGRWWWTVDRWSLFAIGLIIGMGIFLIQAATPAVALKHGWDEYYFVTHHIMLLVPAIGIMVGLSMASPKLIRTIALALLIIFLILLALTPFIGIEIKGAVRWIQKFGFSIQPSEFIKAPFVVVAAWLFARQCERKGFPALSVNIALYGLIVTSLVMQPDIGMTFLISTTWFAQFFLAGLPMILVLGLMGVGIMGLVAAYYTLPHFTSRFDRFLSHTGDTYQVDRALEAFSHGGLFGTGPGEGKVKTLIPDAHADFIFAVAGEEWGLIFCLLIIGLYVFIVMRGFLRARAESHIFVMLAICGLLTQFGLQAAINLASTLHLMPAKGMTLPFISYGGSSLWALAIGMGMLLGLTRKRFGVDDLS